MMKRFPFFQVGTLIAVLAESDEDYQEVAKSAVAEADSSEDVQGQSEQVQQEEEAVPSGGSTPGTEVKMPSLSPTMTEGAIVKWCKKVE